ncbi:phasin family protein [Chondrinema litorale]|uniref:phasin family protein n=1 Tax=Chondrinema litorale TaxID=2994555 RepID=UPI0025432507|nr:hypothetical protein [Chondrinema litorale]UZR92830.1 hypothetical protein OQ292_13295 [Chondrinema litorale]
MEELLKKFLYAGVGIVALTAEKLQKVVDELVKEEKLSIEEGKKIVDDFMKNTEGKKDEFETQLKKVTEKTVKSFRFASKDDVETLKAKVEMLEAELKEARATKPTKKTSTTA